MQEQRRYQTTLRQASTGMSRVKDLKKLLNLIVYIVTRAVRLDHALVYMHDRPKNQFILGAHKRRSGNVTFIKTIADDSPLITYLVETGAPIVYEELKQKIQDYADQDLVAVEKIVAALEGDLVLPILIEKRLLAIIILGKKESGKLYSEDDLSVFSILANQTALAIENAQFYEDMKITQQQLFQAEKMATIGTMADGLSHQINNRFHALGFIAGDALDSLKLSKNMEGSDKVKELLADLERAFNRVQENVVQGGEVVQGLLKYTRKGDAGFAAIDFNQAFKSAFEMAQFKIKVQELQVVHAYDPQNIPKIKGNFTQLQEVFFNLIDNAYDAMMQRKTEKQEPQYQPTLTVRVAPEDGWVEIIFEDNGMGVKKEDVHKLFTPFFTTKLSSKKGTGLGLYVIKKIIEDNHKGKVEMLSDYMAGTRMKLRLPVAVE
ncbi:MAG: ATP-binding protein [Candidatus Omnitrophota bacterium]|nr:ATP-binding protein [Candidatus Omnitrophota bacterium]